MTTRYDRQIAFFGKEGQKKLAAANVAVVGVGGLGTHIVQQLALLGVERLVLIDSEELAATDQNRYVTARHNDPIPGTRKVDIGERLVKEINPQVSVAKIHETFVSEDAFEAIKSADVVFGCLDSDGARLVLNELCAAYARPYLDLATEINPGPPMTYGGRVCAAWDGNGCIVCWEIIDTAEAQLDLAGPQSRRDRDEMYGVKREYLDHTGPSVVSINGVIASIGVTEFMLAVAGIRPPEPLITYRAYMHKGMFSMPSNPPAGDCYYCKGIRGKGDAVDVQRYIRAGVGEFLC